MSNSKETCSLILRTSDISNVNLTDESINTDKIDNEIGRIYNDGSTITWRNIDPNLLFGDMLNKYTKFNLNLCAYSSRKVAVDLADSDMTVFISGLNWSNQSYSLKTKSITREAVLFTDLLNNTTLTGDTDIVNTNTLTFYKPTSNFDITIDMKNGIGNRLNQIMNHQTFVIDIVGCEGYQTNDRAVLNNVEIPANNINNRLYIHNKII